MIRFLRVILVILAAVLVGPDKSIATTTAPNLEAEQGGVVVLSVSYPANTAMEKPNTLFDISALRTFPMDEFETTTIWTSGTQKFRGVKLHVFLECLGVKSGKVKLTAQNNYTIEIPLAEITAKGPLLAFERNGSEMTLRDKGPIWLVYPYDHDPKFRNQTTYARSIWQLDRITVSH